MFFGDHLDTATRAGSLDQIAFKVSAVYINKVITYQQLQQLEICCKCI